MKTRARHRLALTVLSVSALLGASCSSNENASEALSSAEAHFDAGDYDRAEVEYLNALKADPTNATAMVRLGTIYLEQGRLARAFPLLRQARDTHPENVEARIKLGLVFLAASAVDEAAVEANAVLERDPRHAEAPLLLAESVRTPDRIARARQQLQDLLQNQQSAAILTALAVLDLKENKLDAAEQRLQQAQAADSAFVPALGALGALHAARGDTAKADQAFAAAAQRGGNRTPFRLSYARFRLQNRDLKGAREILDEAAKHAPDRLPVLQMQAEVMAAQGQREQSEAIVERILAREPTYLEAILLRARLLIAKREVASAVTLLEKASKDFPQAPMVQHQLGVAYAMSGDLNKAADRFQQALTLDPNHPDALVASAGINLSRGDPRTAITTLQPLVRQRPDLTVAVSLLAEAHRQAGQLEDALTHFRQLESAGNANPYTLFIPGQIALRQNQRDEARRAFEATWQRYPNFQPALEQLVALDVAEKRPDAARQRLQTQLQRTPNSGSLHLLSAQLHFAERQPEQAEAALNRAIELQPDLSAAYALLSRYYMSQGDAEKAIAKLAEAAEKNPATAAGPTMVIALIRQQQGNLAAARDAYEKVLTMQPRSGAALNNLAYLYAEDFKDYDRAYELAQRAREVMPADGSVADTLGWIAYRRKDYAWASTLLQEAANKLSDNATVHYHLGMARSMLGDETGAQASLNRALELKLDGPAAEEAQARLTLLQIDPAQPASETLSQLESSLAKLPDDPVVLVRLASLHEQAGRLDDAIAENEQAQKASPQNIRPLLNLARLHHAKGNKERALEYGRQARKLNSDSPEVATTLGRIAFASGDHGWAASLLQEAARRSTSDPELQLDLAEASFAIGRLDAAQEATDRALTAPVFARANEARQLKNLIAVVQGKGTSVSNAETLGRSDHGPALMAAAVLAERGGNRASAQAGYQKVLAIYPNMTEAQRRLTILTATDSTTDGEQLAMALKAREAFPNDPELARAVGLHLYRQNQFARAIPLFEQASRANANDAELHFLLGQAQRQANRLSAAKASFKRALELNLTGENATAAQAALADLP